MTNHVRIHTNIYIYIYILPSIEIDHCQRWNPRCLQCSNPWRNVCLYHHIRCLENLWICSCGKPPYPPIFSLLLPVLHSFCLLALEPNSIHYLNHRRKTNTKRCICEQWYTTTLKKKSFLNHEMIKAGVKLHE